MTNVKHIFIFFLVVFILVIAGCDSNKNNDEIINSQTNNDNEQINENIDDNKDEENMIDENTKDEQKKISYVLRKQDDRNLTNIDILSLDYEVSGTKNMVDLLESLRYGTESYDALFVHPPSKGETKAIYDIDLTSHSKDEMLILEFYTGFVQGANPEGINFKVYINDELIFDHTKKSQDLKFNSIDISKYASKKISLEFVTAPDPSSDYGWALFLEPIIKGGYNNILIKEDKDILIDKDNEYIIKDIILVDGYVIVEVENDTKEGIYLEISLYNKETKKELDRRVLPLGTNEDNKYIFKIETEERYESIIDIAIKSKNKEEITISNIRYLHNEGILEEESFIVNEDRIFEDEKFEIFSEVLNKGLGSIVLAEDIKYEIKIEGDNTNIAMEQKLGFLNSNQKKKIEFQIDGLEKGEYEVIINRIENNGKKNLYKTKINVIESFFINNEKTIENEYFKIYLFKNNGEYILYVYDKEKDLVLGSIDPGKIKIEDTFYKHNEEEVQGTKEKIELYNINPNGEMKFSLVLDKDNIAISNEFDPSDDVDIQMFFGPIFKLGDSSFGDYRDGAIFPGLDYLDKEPSNHTLAISKPFHDRWAPHPHKVTVPVISTLIDDRIINYSFDAYVGGLEKYNTNSFFQSPSFDGKDYSKMGIFFPNTKEHIKENSFETLKPYKLKSDSKIRLDANIALYFGEGVQDGIFYYMKDFELLDPANKKISFKELLEISLDGFEKAQMPPDGWINFLGLDTSPTMNYEIIHALLAILDIIPENKERVDSIIDSMEMTEGFINWSYYDSIWFKLDKDLLDDYYINAYNAGMKRLNSQLEDGSWIYKPNTQDDKFGSYGDKTMGTISVPTNYLIKVYKLTGEDKFLKGALDGLRAMDRLTKPTGASPWELHNENPDFLAVALGLKAAIEIYEETKQEWVLEVAVKVAKMALPFINVLEYNHSVDSLYTVIPSFGATNFRNPWHGRPVQWEGVLFSKYLKILDLYDDSLNWGKIAKGIDNAAVNMVKTDGELIGRFPDYLTLYNDDPTIYNIWPTLTIASLLYDHDYPARWQNAQTDNARLVTANNIDEFIEKENSLEIVLDDYEDSVNYIMLKSDILYQKIYINDVEIYETNELEEVESGFREANNFDGYIIKYIAKDTTTKIKIIE